MLKRSVAVSAEDAFRVVAKAGRRPQGIASSFVCPFPECGVYAAHAWGSPMIANVIHSASAVTQRQLTGTPLITFAACEACKQEVIFVDGKLLWPLQNAAPVASPDLPLDVAADFEEARLIYKSSPRGAAALLRLVLQKLCPHIGATTNDINKAIGELVESGTINVAIQQALDSVRVIGNESVHPGLMDLKDDHATVLTIFGLINFIVEKTITEPKRIAEIYGGLPAAKLAGIAARDLTGTSGI